MAGVEATVDATHLGTWELFRAYINYDTWPIFAKLEQAGCPLRERTARTCVAYETWAKLAEVETATHRTRLCR